MAAGPASFTPAARAELDRIFKERGYLLCQMQSTQFELHIGARALAAMDYFGKSDPYYLVYSVPDRRQLCKSETIMQDLSPEWKPQVLYVKTHF
jgi:hypothetical protein